MAFDPVLRGELPRGVHPVPGDLRRRTGRARDERSAAGGGPAAGRQGALHHARGPMKLGDDLLMGSDDPWHRRVRPGAGHAGQLLARGRRRSQAGLRRARRRRRGRRSALIADVLLARVRHVHRPLRHAVDDRRRRAAKPPDQRCGRALPGQDADSTSTLGSAAAVTRRVAGRGRGGRRTVRCGRGG